jgi:hypothetical protein
VYGTALDEDLAERLLKGGVDMFLNQYGVGLQGRGADR